VDFGSADRRRGATVGVALEEADRLLPRGPVAERVVHLRVDEARDRRCAVRVDHHVAVLEGRRGGADGGDPAVLHDQRLALREGIAPVARHDGGQVDDRGFHVTSPVLAGQAYQMALCRQPRREI
jgi:hypothetical protein